MPHVGLSGNPASGRIIIYSYADGQLLTEVRQGETTPAPLVGPLPRQLGTRFADGDAAPSAAVTRVSELTTKEALEMWRNHIHSSARPKKTVENYEGIARLMERLFPEKLPTTVQEVEKGLAQLPEHLCHNARRDYIKKIKIVFKFLKDRGHIAVNPMGDIKTPDKKKSGVPLLTPEEMDQLVEMPRQPEWGRFADRDYTYLRLLRNTGLRPGDALSLRQEGITIDDREGLAYLSVQTKTGPEEAICDAETGNLLRELGGDWVFRNKNGKRLGYPGARLEIIKKALVRAGLDRKGLAGHLFRRGFATEAADLDIGPESLQKLLHHQNIEQTMEYVHLARRQVGLKYKKLLAQRSQQLTLTAG